MVTLVFIAAIILLLLLNYLIFPRYRTLLLISYGVAVSYCIDSSLLIFSTLLFTLNLILLKIKANKLRMWLSIMSSLAILILLRTNLVPYIDNYNLQIGVGFILLQIIYLHAFETIETKDLNIAPAELLLFHFYPPKLLAGPIISAHDFILKLRTNHIRESSHKILYGSIILAGLVKKLVVADNLAIYQDLFWNNTSEYHGINTFIFATCIATRFFFDIAAYADITYGLSALLGYRMPYLQPPFICNQLIDVTVNWHRGLTEFFWKMRSKLKSTLLNTSLIISAFWFWHGFKTQFILCIAISLAIANLPAKYLKRLPGIFTYLIFLVCILLFTTKDLYSISLIATNFFEKSQIHYEAAIALFTFCGIGLAAHSFTKGIQNQMSVNNRLMFHFVIILFILLLLCCGVLQMRPFIYAQF